MTLTLPWTRRKTTLNGLSGPIDDVRKALTREVDHIAHLAADLGRDIGTEAAKAREEVTAAVAAQEMPERASGIAQQLLRGVRQFGREIASDSQRTARDVSRDLRSIGRELRAVRVTTEPPPPRVDVKPGIALLAGFGAGIALMYFFDPEDGRRRRALLGDQITKWTRIGRETAEGKAKDLRNRTAGVVHEARKAVQGISAQSDESELATSEYTTGNGWSTEDRTERPAPEHAGVG